MDTKTTARASIAAVTGLITDAMTTAGLAEADAANVAKLMVQADLTGADAHGVFRLPQYIHRLKIASTNPRPTIKVERTAPATALIDGDNGMGHLVVSRACETAIEMARECGIAWVGMRMSNHAGAAGVYAALMVEANMIGIYAAVANANHMPFAGGAENLLGTNPLAVAIPAGEEPPLVLDIATSIVSYGTIKNHRLQNVPLQPGWMVDPKTGEEVLDPNNSLHALLLPMGGYKGAGLALMIGMLAGPLNGALFGRECIDFNATPDRIANTGQFVVALDPARFQPLDAFKAEIDRHIRELRASKALPGQKVRLPGEERAKRIADRKANGLSLPPELVRQLDELAAELSIKPLAER
jgi:LDH2 family malate/lactate/ureidoglycolate dehydrogenase